MGSPPVAHAIARSLSSQPAARGPGGARSRRCRFAVRRAAPQRPARGPRPAVPCVACDRRRIMQSSSCLTACWELLRQARRMVSQDKSESHRPHPREWRRLQRRLRICCGTCGGAGGPARMEWQATTVPVKEELGLGWPLVYIPLDRDNWPTCVTRPCPLGLHEAIGTGPTGVG